MESLGFQREHRLLGNPDHAFQVLERLLRDEIWNENSESDLTPPNAVVVIEFAEKVAPAIDIGNTDINMLLQVEILQRWAINPHFRKNWHMFFLLTRNLADIHLELRSTSSQIELIDIPIPSAIERLQYIAFLFYQYHRFRAIGIAQGKNPNDYPVMDFSADDFKAKDTQYPRITQQMEQFANLTAGLNRVGIHDIVKRSFQDEQPITGALIRQRKEAIIRTETGDILDVMTPKYSLKDDIGGLEAIKKFLMSDVIEPLISTDPRTKKTVPSGVLFLGPPGTGKTIVAEALAKESNVNLVKLGNIRGMYVGQSERNLERALNIIRSMTPVIVFMDELDQSEGRRSEHNMDSGVSSRIFSQLLQFMSDGSLRGQVVWIAASNRPDLIDAAMRRPGRFDDKLPFLPPNEEQRADIIRKMLQHKFSQPQNVVKDLEPTILLCASKEAYTGAELEVILGRAVRFAKGIVKADDLEKAFDTFIPSRDLLMTEYMTLLALQEVNDRRFIDELPANYRKYFGPNGAKELNISIQDILRTIRGR